MKRVSWWFPHIRRLINKHSMDWSWLYNWIINLTLGPQKVFIIAAILGCEQNVNSTSSSYQSYILVIAASPIASFPPFFTNDMSRTTYIPYFLSRFPSAYWVNLFVQLAISSSENIFSTTMYPFYLKYVSS